MDCAFSWVLQDPQTGSSSSPCSRDRRPVLVTSRHSELRSVHHPSMTHKPRSPPAKATCPIPRQVLLCLRFPKLSHMISQERKANKHQFYTLSFLSYCSFIVSFENRQYKSSSFVLFQNCFCFSSSFFFFCINFRINIFISMENVLLDCSFQPICMATSISWFLVLLQRMLFKNLLKFPNIIASIQYQDNFFFGTVILYPVILHISTSSFSVDSVGIFYIDNLIICEYCYFSLSNPWARSNILM